MVKIKASRVINVSVMGSSVGEKASDLALTIEWAGAKTGNADLIAEVRGKRLSLARGLSRRKRRRSGLKVSLPAYL